MDKETFDQVVSKNPWIKEMRIRVEGLRQLLDRDLLKGFYDNYFFGSQSPLDPNTSYLYQCVLQYFYQHGVYKEFDSNFSPDHNLEKLVEYIMIVHGASQTQIEQVLNHGRIFHIERHGTPLMDARHYLEDELQLNPHNYKYCYFDFGSSEFAINAFDIVNAAMNIISLISGAITIADYYKRWSKQRQSELRDKVREQLIFLQKDCNEEEIDKIITNVIELIKK